MFKNRGSNGNNSRSPNLLRAAHGNKPRPLSKRSTCGCTVKTWHTQCEDWLGATAGHRWTRRWQGATDASKRLERYKAGAPDQTTRAGGEADTHQAPHLNGDSACSTSFRQKDACRWAAQTYSVLHEWAALPPRERRNVVLRPSASSCPPLSRPSLRPHHDAHKPARMRVGGWWGSRDRHSPLSSDPATLLPTGPRLLMLQTSTPLACKSRHVANGRQGHLVGAGLGGAGTAPI
jgi:hypothetical protein